MSEKHAPNNRAHMVFARAAHLIGQSRVRQLSKTHVVVGDHDPEPKSAPRKYIDFAQGGRASMHFLIERQPSPFHAGETMRPRYVHNEIGLSDIVGLDKVTEVGEFVEPIIGRMLAAAPLDERTRLPVKVNGVQLWRGWDDASV
jgi:hypothetical protein